MGARWVWGLAAGLALAVTVNAGADRTAPANVNTRLAIAHARNAAASQNATKAAPNASAQPMDPDTLVSSVCVDCHYEDNKDKTAGLSFENFKISEIAQHPDVGERMIRKLRAGMMPPPPTPLPDAASYNGLINALETRLDAAGASKPNPGGRVFQRLNRTEYASAIKDLLGLEVNAGDWLPLDSLNSNFDNIADEQMISATLIESYLNAASEISRMAVGDRQAPSLDRTFVASTYESQHPWDYIEGAPYGTRGGMVVKYVFPPTATTCSCPSSSAATTRAARISISRSTACASRSCATRRSRQAAPTDAVACRCRPSPSKSAPDSTSCPPRSCASRMARTKISFVRTTGRSRAAARAAPASRRCPTCASSRFAGRRTSPASRTP